MQVNVNGKSFNVPNGANVSIINNVLYVDGQEYTGDGYESKQFKIEITGGVANVKVERGDVTVHGDATMIFKSAYRTNSRPLEVCYARQIDWHFSQ